MCIRDRGTVDPCTIIQEGEAIGTFYGFKWAGLQKNDKGQWVAVSYTHLIIDPTGEPVIGATVTVKGKQGGTITDLDGKFVLSDVQHRCV